jgi:hypothetical protein
MTQDQIAELFGKDRTTISKHIASIYSDGELIEEKTQWLNKANVQNMHIGNNKPTKYYKYNRARKRGSKKPI